MLCFGLLPLLSYDYTIAAQTDVCHPKHRLRIFPAERMQNIISHRHSQTFPPPDLLSAANHVGEVRWEKEVGGGPGSPGLLSGLGHAAGGQPGERRRRAVHPAAAGAHRGQLLGAEAPPGGQRPDMDGAVPGAERPGPPAGGSGPAVGPRVLPHRRRPAAADLRQLRAGGHELLGGDPLHHRERGIHPQALPRSAARTCCTPLCFVDINIYQSVVNVLFLWS